MNSESLYIGHGETRDKRLVWKEVGGGSEWGVRNSDIGERVSLRSGGSLANLRAAVNRVVRPETYFDRRYQELLRTGQLSDSDCILTAFQETEEYVDSLPQSAPKVMTGVHSELRKLERKVQAGLREVRQHEEEKLSYANPDGMQVPIGGTDPHRPLSGTGPKRAILGGLNDSPHAKNVPASAETAKYHSYRSVDGEEYTILLAPSATVLQDLLLHAVCEEAKGGQFITPFLESGMGLQDANKKHVYRFRKAKPALPAGVSFDDEEGEE